MQHPRATLRATDNDKSHNELQRYVQHLLQHPRATAKRRGAGGGGGNCLIINLLGLYIANTITDSF